MLRKFIKAGDFAQVINPPAHSPVFGMYDRCVSYKGYADWLLPERFSRRNLSRLQTQQSGLQSLTIAQWGDSYFIDIEFNRSERMYFLTSLKAHMQSDAAHELLDNERLLLRTNSREDLVHVLSVLHDRHQLDPDTKADIEASLQVRIELTAVDAKLLMMQGRFDEVYAHCQVRSAQFCHKVGYHAIKHYGNEHPEWSIRFYLAARLDGEYRFYFGYSYFYAVKHIAERIIKGEPADFNVFDHITFDQLFDVFTSPSGIFRGSPHLDGLYYLGVYCKENDADDMSWAIKCFKSVPPSDKNYQQACDALLHLEMQGHCTSEMPEDKHERMLRYVLAGIPENRWMAQHYFAQLAGATGGLISLPNVGTDIDSVVLLAKHMRVLHDENAQLKARVASLESELKKSKSEVVVTKPTLF